MNIDKAGTKTSNGFHIFLINDEKYSFDERVSVWILFEQNEF